MSRLLVAGPEGQIELGKAYAGRPLLLEEQQPGVWTIQIGKFIPEQESKEMNSKTRDLLEEVFE